MNGIKGAYYWDSCIFLSLFKNERPEERGKKIRVYFDHCKSGNIQIISSAIMRAEVLDTGIGEANEKKLEELLSFENFQTISVDDSIAIRAGELRQYFRSDEQKRINQKKILSTPDAIHLATAEIQKVKEFHTYDKSNQDTLGLLPLNGKLLELNYSIPIVMPGHNFKP